MKRSFCSACGQSLALRRVEDRDRLVCTACGTIQYLNPLPVASVLLAGPGAASLLLVRRRHEPYRGAWCFPIGFAEMGESIEAAALRELEEEAGVQGRILTLLDASSFVSDFYGDLLIVSFEAEQAGGEVHAGDDAEEARFVPIEEIPDLPFAPQARSLAAWRRLHAEEWTIRRAMDEFLHDARTGNLFAAGRPSDDLLRVISEDADAAVAGWTSDVLVHPTTQHYHGMPRADLEEAARFVLAHFAGWITGRLPASGLRDYYRELGARRRREGFPLHEVLSSLQLLKKNLWAASVARGYSGRLLDVYRVLELDKRLSWFFDHATFHLARGWAGDGQG